MRLVRSTGAKAVAERTLALMMVCCCVLIRQAISEPKVSFELKDATASEVLHKMAESAGISYVARDLPTGRSSFACEEASIEDAFELFARRYRCEVAPYFGVWVVNGDEAEVGTLDERMRDVIRTFFGVKDEKDYDASAQAFHNLVLAAWRADSARRVHGLDDLPSEARQAAKVLLAREWERVLHFSALNIHRVYRFFQHLVLRPVERTEQGRITVQVSGPVGLIDELRFGDDPPQFKGYLIQQLKSKGYLSDEGVIDYARFAERELAPLSVRKGVAVVLGRKVTVSVKADNVGGALRALGDAAGVSLQMPQPGRMEVQMQCTELPFWQVMDALSAVTGLLWSPEDDALTYSLQRQPELGSLLFEQLPVLERLCWLVVKRVGYSRWLLWEPACTATIGANALGALVKGKEVIVADISGQFRTVLRWRLALAALAQAVTTLPAPCPDLFREGWDAWVVYVPDTASHFHVIGKMALGGQEAQGNVVALEEPNPQHLPRRVRFVPSNHPLSEAWDDLMRWSDGTSVVQRWWRGVPQLRAKFAE